MDLWSILISICNKTQTISCFTLLQISCKSDDDIIVDECEGVTCSPDIYIPIILIIDGNQDPVPLDSYEVIDIATGDVLTTSIPPAIFEQYQQSGKYPLKIGNLELHQEKDLLFKGFINDMEVISSSYKVRMGCCGIGLVSGDVDLVLE